MIKEQHLDDVTNKIIQFLEGSLESKGLSSFVFYVSGGVDTALVAALCARCKYPSFPVEVIGYKDPIMNTNKVFEICCSLNLINHIKIDIGPGWKQIVNEMKLTISNQQQVISGLVSCIRMSVLDCKAKTENAAIVGGLNRDEDMVIRSFHKRGQGAADLFPIADLHKSEIRQLATHLGMSSNITKAVSTLDTNGDGTRPNPNYDEIWLTSEQLEWARIEMDKWTKTIGAPLNFNFNSVVEQNYKFFYDYESKKLMFPEHWTKDQKELMEKVIEIEYQTRYKNNPTIPVCHISDKYRENNNVNSST